MNKPTAPKNVQVKYLLALAAVVLTAIMYLNDGLISGTNRDTANISNKAAAEAATPVVAMPSVSASPAATRTPSAPETASAPASAAMSKILSDRPPEPEFLAKHAPHRRAEPELSPERKERRRILNNLRESAASQNWDLFMENARIAQSFPDFLKSTALTTAIARDAPQQVFEQLTAMGYVFEAHHSTRVANKNSIQLLERLIPLGLDIHASTAKGDNAVNTLLNTLASRKVFNYLLAHNVVVKPGSDGKNLLTKTLAKAASNKEAVFYLYKLVKQGEKVQPSHIEQAKALQATNPGAFALITRNVPELLEAP